MPRSRLPVDLARNLRKRLTPQELKLWNWMREGPVRQGHHFRRQVPIGRFIVDFACLKPALIIEVDGNQHGSDLGRLRDAARDRWLASAGYRVLRFSNHDVDHAKEVVMDTILAALLDLSRAPSVAFGATSPVSGGGSVPDPGSRRL
jgi:very-short-patch-repair endonuclease